MEVVCGATQKPTNYLSFVLDKNNGLAELGTTKSFAVIVVHTWGDHFLRRPKIRSLLFL